MRGDRPLTRGRFRCIIGYAPCTVRAVENLRMGVVEIEHDEETTNDHLTCSVCSWRLGVSPREYALRLARRHDDAHKTGAERGRAGHRGAGAV